MVRILDGLSATVGERFRLPAVTSPRAEWWIAAHRALLLPLVSAGTAHRYRAHCDGAGVQVLGVGDRERLEPFLSRLLAGVQLLGTSGRQLLWPVERRPEDADLVALDMHPWLAGRFRSAGWLVCPEMVRWVGRLSDMPPAKPSRSLRSDLRRVARGGYILEVTRGTTRDWEVFEREMLLPSVTTRFGEQAWRPSPALMRALRKRGLLHFVKRDGRRLGGACVVRHGDTVWVPLGGIKDGDLDLMREGVDSAHLWLTIEWARRLGMDRLDLGRTSPFCLDGIARYKRKWGMSPVADPLSRQIAIWVRPSNRSLRQALERQPFLVMETDGALRPYPK
jgi:hypothetical protein